jgi:protein-disulfide isomerase
MNRRFALLSGGAAILGGGYLFLGRNGVKPGVSFGSAAAQDADVDTSQVVEMALGDPDAPVTVIEYASFTCPHCATFHAGPFKDLKANYIDTGKIRFIYREVYFDRYGLWAAMVARCGGEDRYFGIADMIYDQQSQWTASNDPATIADNLRRIGRTAGLTDEQVNACLQDREMAESMVALYQENAERDDINSTPSFVINGQKYSNMSYADFAAILDEALAG